MSGLEQTVELDRAEVLAALRKSKQDAGIVDSRESASQTSELRAAIATIKKWAEANDQWLVVLAPWGMHHYGTLTEEQVELILKRFTPGD